MIGKSLGPYQIVAKLGEGGMGEVYAARDSRLGRTVAVKVLPSGFAVDAGRRARFEREARAIASLAHPHICTIHDVGDHDGMPYLVMEHLEGETLAARLARSRMPLPEALAYAVQIASGLECAHRAGIVHRDLKPANIMLTKTGATLLDFGLAKPMSDQIRAGDTATATAPLTMQGEIVGTLAYMAPEQLEGTTVDERTDIFAFGTIVHEMVTGQRAFAGASQAGIIGAILHSHPPSIVELVPGAPRALARLVVACVAKDPRDRWSSAHDVRLQLEALEEGAGLTTAAAAVPHRSRERLAWIAAAVALLAALALGVLFVDQSAATRDSDCQPGVSRAAPGHYLRAWRGAADFAGWAARRVCGHRSSGRAGDLRARSGLGDGAVARRYGEWRRSHSGRPTAAGWDFSPRAN